MTATKGTVPTPHIVLHPSTSDLRDLVAKVEAATRAGLVIAIDLETTGLDSILDLPRLLQLGLPDGEVHIIDLFEAPRMDALLVALSRATVVAHNALFDLSFLYVHLGLSPAKVLDTMVMSRLCAGEASLGGNKPHSLEACCRRHLGLDLPKSMQRADWSGDLSYEHLIYAARDVVVLHDLLVKLEDGLAMDGLEKVAELEHDFIPVVVAMSAAGVGVDQERWTALLREQSAEVITLRERLVEGLGGCNVDSPKQVLRELREQLGLDLSSTSAETLAPHCSHPIVRDLLAYRSRSRFVGPRGDGSRIAHQLQDYPDSRCHPRWKPLAAATGRMYVSQPNLQGMPRDEGFRGCVVPAEGYRLIVADYAGIELRVAAAIAGDRSLLDLFQEGRNPHAEMGARISGLPLDEVTKKTDAYKMGKIANFGPLFGGGPGVVQRAAMVKHGINLSTREAERIVRSFSRSYRSIDAWQRRVERHARRTGGRVDARTRLGRSRRLEAISLYDRERWVKIGRNIRQALNLEVQGTAADGMKLGMVRLHDVMGRMGGRIVAAIHDEVIVEVPNDSAEEGACAVKNVMERAMMEYVPEVPIVIEVSVRDSWE